MAVEITPSSNSVFHRQKGSFRKFMDGPMAKNYLWQHQITAVKECVKRLESTSQEVAMCVMPTGTGKTGVIVLVPYCYGAEKVLIITPSETVSKQIYYSFIGKQSSTNPLIYNESFLERRGLVDESSREHALPLRGGLIMLGDKEFGWMQSEVVVTNAHRIGNAKRQSRIRIEDIPNDLFDLVIVDEAHHYPADTWRLVVDYFIGAKKLFLTATPFHGDEPVLGEDFAGQREFIAFSLTKEVAINQGIIRNIEFFEVNSENHSSMNVVAEAVKEKLKEHDAADPLVFHQAMILTQTRSDLNSAEEFKEVYNRGEKSKELCDVFASNVAKDVPDDFTSGKFRTLVVVGKLREGYDNPHVSVVAICRNVTSRLLFEQMVGRAVRKVRPDDPVTATVISHPKHHQSIMFDEFERYAKDEEESDDEEWQLESETQE